MADELKLLIQHRSELFGFVRALLRSTHDAEDVFQEVAAIIVQKANEGAEIRDFRAWAKEIARNCALRHFRNRRTDKTVSLPSEEMLAVIGDVYDLFPVEPARAAEESEALRACLREMPDRTRALVRLRYVADRSYERIAESVGQNAEAVRRAVNRARLALLECVQRRIRITAQN